MSRRYGLHCCCMRLCQICVTAESRKLYYESRKLYANTSAPEETYPCFLDYLNLRIQLLSTLALDCGCELRHRSILYLRFKPTCVNAMSCPHIRCPEYVR